MALAIKFKEYILQEGGVILLNSPVVEVRILLPSCPS